MTAVENLLQKADMLLDSWTGTIRLPRVAVTGPYNAGKSSLINTLLGDQLAPVGITPTTMLPVYFAYSDSCRVLLINRKGKTPVNDLSLLKSAINNSRNLQRVEIYLPHPLLKRCSLLDTPGFDTRPEHRAAALHTAADADVVLFLLHQRGIDDSSKLFLETLARKHGKKAPDMIFALNYNIGAPDDSPFKVTTSSLRQIFKAGINLYPLDTGVTATVDDLRRLLEVESAARITEAISQEIKAMDAGIPLALQGSLSRRSDADFLDDFWDIRSRASCILLAGEITRPLAVARHTVRAGAHSTGPGQGISIKLRATGARRESGPPGLAQINKSLHSLLDRITGDADLVKLHQQTNSLLKFLPGQVLPLALTGGFSSGKSTFINALLGEEILTTGDGPTTSCITRIRHSPLNEARLHYPLQITVPVVHLTELTAEYCQEEVLALTRWLAGPESGELGHLELLTRGSSRRAHQRQVLDQLNKVTRLFAAGLGGQTGIKLTPTLFRPIPAKRITPDLPLAVRVTFRQEKQVTHSLANGADRFVFQKDTTWPQSFRLGVIEIWHPSELLRGLALVDTPGTDSVYRRHRSITADYLGGGVPVLFFLNARHVLNAADRDRLSSFPKVIQAGLSGSVGADGTKSARLQLVINFTDTLKTGEQEKIRSFIVTSLAESGISQNYNLFFVSARQALTNPEHPSFMRLVATIRHLAGLYTAPALAGIIKELKASLTLHGRENPGARFYLTELGHLERRLARAAEPGPVRRN